MTPNYQLIRRAILSRNIVTAYYDNHYRELCPHVIGTDEDGTEKAFFYQFGGHTSGGPVERQPAANRWRCFFIAKMSQVQIRSANGAWHTSPNYADAQTCIPALRIDAETGAA